MSTGGLKTGPAAPAAPAQRLEEMDVEAAFSHLPVMVREVVELLLPVPDGLIVDCTVGGGGHTAALLEARSDIRLLGIDRDADAVAAARLRLAPFGARVQVVELIPSRGLKDIRGRQRITLGVVHFHRL